MKALLKILYFIVFTIILILMAGFFLPKKYTISNSINIATHTEIVFEQIDVLSNWEHWLSLSNADSATAFEYGTQKSGEGASFIWPVSAKAMGELRITKSVNNESVAGVELIHGEEKSTFTLEIVPNAQFVTVNWEVICDEIKFLERYVMIFLKKKMGRQYLKSLSDLKEICEDLHDSRISDPGIIEFPAAVLMSIVDSVEFDEIDTKINENFIRLKAYIDRRQLTKTGDSMVIFYSRNPKEYSQIACAVPIEKRTWGWKHYKCISLDTLKAIKVKHWGSYKSEKPYLAIDEFLNKHNLKRDSFIWETYQIGPLQEPDTSLWEMTIYYPLRSN